MTRDSRFGGSRIMRVLLALGLATTACSPLRTRVSGELVWTRPEIVTAADMQELAVAPGEVVRITTEQPVRVVSVVRTPQGEAEVATTMTPKGGAVLVRPPLGTTALRVPRGIVVHAGAPREPELSWFDLENEALAWAHTPLGTPFPPLAAAPRIDVAEIGEMDAALADARKTATDQARADAAIAGLRGMIALRAVRAVEGVRSYPYARNGEIPFETSGGTREIQDRTFVQLTPGRSATITIEGPTSLAVSSRVIRGVADVVAEVRVRETGRVRGSARAVIHHLAPEGEQGKSAVPPLPSSSDAELDPTLAPLRRVFVHVPPGSHTYEVDVVGAPAWIAATDSSAYLRIEDAFSGAKNEKRLLSEAKQACSAPAVPGACALALVLAGEDAGAGYDEAMAAAPPSAQRVAVKLAAGAPLDRAGQLESGAATGDQAALVTLGRDAAATIDASLRDAWWRGTLRGTTWQTLDDGAPPTWFAFLPRDAAVATCGAGRPGNPSAPSERELDAQPFTAFAIPWRRARAVRLLAVAPCAPAEPMQIEVDGQTLSAQPGSARAIWHVIVRGDTAKIRRVDHGPGHVYALSDDACNGHGSLVHAATPLAPAEPRTIAFPAKTSAPGVEVWIKDGVASESFAITSNDGAERLDVVARAGAGLVAIDEQGTRWKRAATIPLPAWGVGGIRVSGAASIAVRPVARGSKTELDAKPIEHALPPNVDALVAASRKLLAAKTPEARGAAALERALLLASYGAERAALEDAELAKSYAPSTADPVAVVRRGILAPAPTPLEVGAGGYGVEPDFDPKAQRCAVTPDGPRARIAALDAALRVRSKSAPYDRSLAVQAATLANAAPQDPRVETLVTLATTSSKWRLLKEVEGGGGRVPRPHEKDANPVLDADARLRARLHAGDPFGNSFVSVSPDRPARAFVADIGAAKARLDVVCVPRRAAIAGEKCPLDVKMGDVPVPARVGEDGRATIDLPHGRGRGKGAELSVSVASSRGDYIALIRIVLDAQIAGTTEVKGVGWVLDTPHIQYRFLLPPNRPIRLRPAAPGLVRIDAVPEPGETVEVVASAGGRELPIPTSGETKIIPVATAGEVLVTARGGTATVAIAERLDADSKTPESDVDPRGATVRQVDTTSARVSVADGAWRDVAESSPRPLSWLEDSLGTLESNSGGVAGTMREGAPSDTALDAYGFESLTYRRRIESLNLFTLGSGVVRVRDGKPTYGASLSLYEDITAIRLRVTGTLGAFAQEVGAGTAATLRPRGFVEYSARLASDVFFLPRVGYDGYYTNLPDRPPSSKNIDDDIYNAFRFKRNSFAFAQGLLWYVPFFNELVYLRARGTYDITNGAFSHAAVRPGMFFIMRALELAAYVDGQYFERTTGARTSSGVDLAAGGGVSIHLPIAPGSFEIRPNSMAQVRADGGWQVLAGIALIASYRRGARDYSSLELSFPEETSGGIPWRTESKGP